MQSLFGIKFKAPVVGPSAQELNTTNIEVHQLQSYSYSKTQLFEDNFSALNLKTPDTLADVSFCKSGVEQHINLSDQKAKSLIKQNQNLTQAIDKISKESDWQHSMHLKSASVIKTFKAPDMKMAEDIHIRALNIPPAELVHTRIYEDVCRLHDVTNFDIILRKTPDVNASSQGRAPVDYATLHRFDHGITSLIKAGANSADAFIYSLNLGLVESYKLLTFITGKLVGHQEIFSNLQSDKKILALDLADTSLSKDSLLYLSEALTDNSFLALLNLSKNNIDTLGVVPLAKMLGINQHIIELDLSNNKLGYQGIIILVGALEANTGTKNLNISVNNIGIEGGAIVSTLITSSKILDLNVSSNNIEDMGAAHMLSKINRDSAIRQINLANNGITDALAEDLEEILNDKLSSIITLDLTNNNLSSDKLRSIEQIMFSSAEHKIQDLLTDSNHSGYDHSLELLAEVQELNDF
jgi:hypothetical protein